LPRTETQLIAGAGSQTGPCPGTCHRWGDYSSMSIDPSDGCTFWYTTEYFTSASNGGNSPPIWSSRIGSFKFPSCAAATPTPTPTPTATPTPAPIVQVTVQTSPTGLTFSVDGTTYSSTQTFSWASGSSHTIATTSPQSGGSGVRYVWSSWTGGGAISHTVAPTTNKTYTATFRTQYYLTMTHGTGGTVTPASGWKNSGSAVSISATPTNNTQVSYRFDHWTGTGAGSYSGTNNPASITMNGPITENATFIQNPVQVSVQTNPSGRTFSVDGTTYSLAQTFSWNPGSSHTIATTSPQNGSTGVRYVWSNWSGGGAISHSVAPTTNKTYTATFSTQYYLTMSHGTGGTVTPASGWRGSGTTVSITATPASGYSFTNWTGSGTGSFSGTNNPASITMGGPITETATFTHN
jgi:List-Bact-rpt repeat protein